MSTTNGPAPDDTGPRLLPDAQSRLAWWLYLRGAKPDQDTIDEWAKPDGECRIGRKPKLMHPAAAILDVVTGAPAHGERREGS